MKRQIFSLALVTALTATAFSCGQKGEQQLSTGKVTDVEHTTVKRQSIGNCWLYATSSWAESLDLQEAGDEINYSESYWTWWHFYDQLIYSSHTELRTGGSFSRSSTIILEHGAVLEGEFLPNEADLEMSVAQASAVSLINSELVEGGRLGTYESRTPEAVRALLDEAFGAKMADAELIAIPASDMIGGQDRFGNGISMYEALAGNVNQRWRTVNFPRLYGEEVNVPFNVANNRKNLMRRVLRALNDRLPIIMTLMIDFNAMSTEDGTFSVETLEEAGEPGTQGGHMVSLEDYVVDNVPGVGTIGEGDVSDELKQLALQGDVRYLKAKNSWGTNRPERGLTDGYTRFTTGYLEGQLGWLDDPEEEDSTISHYTTLTDFVLPPGY